ncbi:hypothetical protein [Halarchaeum nitratireducens]|uniref:Uncharacterized protein n=1 Tax=Halarchaeum nitratireducens TaxID=489913 RepID=A0A830GB79_9EURY|nr:MULTISPECIES: hypothetical protein [Halarchaeum]MBP2252124.1 apolipoprotein N-acyltransferase [Halarchaeum solikamskense]GGN17093.1 hypothetical protein GCM10009021_17270 [Halarchaeum nitratireducens]
MNVFRTDAPSVGLGLFAGVAVGAGLYTLVLPSLYVAVALGALYGVGAYLLRCVHAAVGARVDSFGTSVWDRLFGVVGVVAGFLSVTLVPVDAPYRVVVAVLTIGVLVLSFDVAVAATLGWLTDAKGQLRTGR